MFPTSITNSSAGENKNTQYNIISDNEKIRLTPDYDFENAQTVINDGDVSLVDNHKNVRNWIAKFFDTKIDKNEIYEGTGFGTSLYMLKGKKNISGEDFAQIKKEIDDGFTLNPNIDRVEDFNLYRENKTTKVYLKVKLIDGYILEENQEVIFLKDTYDNSN